MGAKFTSEVSEKQEGNEKDGGRFWWEKWTFSDIFSALVIDSVRKYLRNFDVIDFAIIAHSITENKVYRFWQKTKKQHPSLMGIWNKWTGLYFKPFGTKWHAASHEVRISLWCTICAINYGHSCTALLGPFPAMNNLSINGSVQNMKSCNLKSSVLQSASGIYFWYQKENAILWPRLNF